MPDVFQTLTTETMIAVLLILALVVALVVNARRKRRSDIKMNARVVRDDTPAPDPHDRTSRELPNGGGRVVGRHEPTFGEFFSEPDPGETTGDSVEHDSSPRMDDEDLSDADLGGETLTSADIAQRQEDEVADTPIDPGTMDWLDEIEVVPTSQGQSARLPRRKTPRFTHSM